MILDGHRVTWRHYAAWTICAAAGALAGIAVPAAVLYPAAIAVLVAAHAITRRPYEPIPTARRLKP